MLDRPARFALKHVASINHFILPGAWTLRHSRRAIPLPVRLDFDVPRGARLHSYIDRGEGWERFDLDHVPREIGGSGWWGDPELFLTHSPEFILGRIWRKVRMGDWKPRHPATPRPLPSPRPIQGRPLVSILIPTDGRIVNGLKGRLDLISNCYRSIVTRSSYPNLEILIGHNGRISPGIPSLPYLSPGPFRLSHKLNFLIDQARGDYLVILNDDTEVIEPGWVEALLEYAQIPEVGAVGARLHFPDGRIQHAGIAFGISTLCGHVYAGHPYDCPGAARPRECSAVTGACMMFRRGERMDERYAAIFDVDFCLRQRAKGKRVIYAPRARLFHHESATIGLGETSVFPEKIQLRQRWPDCLPDPFFARSAKTCAPGE